MLTSRIGKVISMTLATAQAGKEYRIQNIATNDQELSTFLFTLGCYSGEPITVISRRRGGCVVSVKDGRYSIDKQLANAIALSARKAAQPMAVCY